MVFDHVCGTRNCAARCRFAQFRPLHPRFGRSSRHRRRSLTCLSCRSPALGQIFLCQIKMHPCGCTFICIAHLNCKRRDLVFDHVCGTRNCSARCRFAQFRPLHPRFGRSSRHRRRSLTRLSCRSPALGQIFLCQMKKHPCGCFFIWRRRRALVFDHVCGARNCSARCRFAQFRPLHPRIGRSSRHRRRSLPRLSCRSPALGQIFLCQIKMHPYGVHFYLAEKERFELSRRLSRPTPLAGAPLRPLEYFSKGCQRSSQN